MKEYELFIKYESTSYYNSNACNTFDLIKSAINNKQVDMLDLECCAISVNEIMQFLHLKKRFIFLEKIVGSNLSVKENGFSFYDSTFSTLDEVERAMKLKAFL